MTNLKLTKRTLISSAIALFLCFAMLIGTTLAWFTDSVESTNNKIVAGTLDIELYQWNGDVTDGRENATAISTSSAPVFPDDILWEPGYTHVVYLSIKNEGSLALKYKVALEVTSVSEESLLDVMSYAITPDAKYNTVSAWAGNGTYINAGYNEDANAQDIALLPGEEHFFALSVHMDEDAGNEYQDQSIAFDIKVLAGQLASEEDSFGPNYDADAEYSASGTKTIVDTTVPTTIYTNNIANVVIPAGASAGTYTFSMNNRKVETDSSNATTISVDLELLKDNVSVTDDGTKYLVEIEIGTNKRVIAVTHNGYTVDEYNYDATTGILSFETTSFSPFTFKFDTLRTVTGLQGSGTEADPYLINDYYDLCWFRDSVNTYTSDGSNQYKNKYVKLTADIDLNGINWQPIGDNTTNDHEAFMGIFDGDGHTISNLYINADGDHLGFFARTGSYNEAEKAVVKNLNFENVDVSANVTYHWSTGHGDYVGGVIANAGGNTVVENVNVSGYVYVDGCGYVGGIVGHGYPTVNNCSVTAEDGSYILCGYWSVGGIVGYLGEGAKVSDCSVVGLGEDGLYIYGAYGAAAAICGNARDGSTGNNLYASNVEISGDDYALGYLFGNGGTVTNSSVENVRLPEGAEASDSYILD